MEPGNLGGMGFGAAPVCSETFTMAEDPKASAVGEKNKKQLLSLAWNLNGCPKLIFLLDMAINTCAIESLGGVPSSDQT